MNSSLQRIEKLQNHIAKMLNQMISLFICLITISQISVYGEKSFMTNCGSRKCRRISEIYSKPNLPFGYMQITTLPVDAFNVSIKQMDYTENRLALKSMDDQFIINGDSSPSSSGSYEYDGIYFEYEQPPIENESDKNQNKFEEIFSMGPTTKPVDVLILVKDQNPGIKWEYLLLDHPDETSPETTDYYEDYENIDWNEPNTPQDFTKTIKNNEIEEVKYTQLTGRKRKKYMWKIINFTPCSKSCGDGIQTPVFKCTREYATRFYSPRRCMHIEKPIFNENIYKCNLQPCPAFWHTGDWENCNCFLGEGYQRRDVRCVQAVSEGVVIEVKNSSCNDPRPDVERKCDCWMGPKRGSRLSQRIRQYTPLRGSLATAPLYRRSQHNNSTGIWLASDWYSNCSTSCGTGFEHRSIFCDRTLPHSDRCNSKVTPDTMRTCVSEANCEQGEWATTDWGACRGECFNLQKRRQVFCVRKGVIVDEAECTVDAKPATTTGCSLDDVNYCRPRWYYSEWTMCSKTCGGGAQRRSVKCLELDRNENILRESQKCLFTERQPIHSSCNTKTCPEMVMDSRVDLMHNEPVTCVDIFKNCAMINKSKFCKSAYYQRHCCFTCKEFL